MKDNNTANNLGIRFFDSPCSILVKILRIDGNGGLSVGQVTAKIQIKNDYDLKIENL